MFRNPLRTGKTYLRKKSELLLDYTTIGTFFIISGLFFSYQYKKFNPPDPVKEPTNTQEYHILDFIQDKVRKRMNVKYGDSLNKDD